jgi:hypothetical protein
VSDVRDLASLGVLGAFVPRDVVDAVINRRGLGARRSDGKLPPWSVAYLNMLLGLYPDDDYEELAFKVAPLVAWSRGQAVGVPASPGAVTQARDRLGWEVMAEVFEQVAVPVAQEVTEGAFLGSRRMMAIDGFEVDVADSPANVAEFGRSGGEANPSAFPKVRVVAVTECASRAVVSAQMGPIAGKGTGERSLAGCLWDGLTPDMLLLADRGFYSWGGWAAAADTGADLLWRVGDGLALPVVEKFADGSYLSVIIDPQVRGRRRPALLEAATSGRMPDPGEARFVRVVEYDVPDRPGNGHGELVVLITTITDPAETSAQSLAEAYHRRWDAETAFDQVKEHLRPPGKVLRSKSPDLVRAELYGLLLTQWALAKLICDAATEAAIEPGRVKHLRAIRIVRRHATSEAAFPP